MKKKLNTRDLVVVAMLGAITVVLGLTPLGFIPLGPLNATTMHIPVIVASITQGPIIGGLVGLIFGLSSLWNAITRPTVISFVFYNPLISIVPRVLLGLIPYYLYSGLKKIEGNTLKKIITVFWIVIAVTLVTKIVTIQTSGADKANLVPFIIFLVISIVLMFLSLRAKKNQEAVMISSFLSTILHSVMVLGGIYLFFVDRYVEALEIPMEAARATIFGVIITSGIPEGILAVLVTTAVVSAISKMNK